jgi:lipoyl(octanoyl) transferase
MSDRKAPRALRQTASIVRCDAPATFAPMLFDELTEVLDPEPHAAALNMALDEVLLGRAAGPLLRVYRWARPAVSFGYFGNVADVEAAWPGREMVRRWTGGGIVPHGEDVTYTLIVPRRCAFFRLGAEETYRAIHERIATLLAAHGRAVRVAAAAQAKVSDACFENPARYDLLTDAGKIAGAAQRRTKAGLLHQGSIQGAALPADFGAQLAKAFADKVCGRLLALDEVEEARELSDAKYATDAWLRRL